jgi:hypothetical protein
MKIAIILLSFISISIAGICIQFDKSYYPVSEITKDQIGTWMNLCTTKDSIYAILNHKDTCHIKVRHINDTNFIKEHCEKGVLLLNPKAIDLILIGISNDTLDFSLHRPPEDSIVITILKSEICGVCSEPPKKYQDSVYNSIYKRQREFSTFYIGTSISHHFSGLIYNDSMRNCLYSNSFGVQFGYTSNKLAIHNISLLGMLTPGIDFQYSSRKDIYLNISVFSMLEILTIGYSLSYSNDKYYNGLCTEINTKRILSCLLYLVLPSGTIFNKNGQYRFTLEPILKANYYFNHNESKIDAEYGILFRYYLKGLNTLDL